MFNDLQIAIPSRSRPNVKTVFNLSQNLWTNIIIIVPSEQYAEYRAAIPIDIDIIPFDGQGVATKREFILNSKPSGKLIMLDDDLAFYKRLEDGSKFTRMSIVDTEKMIADIVDFLDRYVMVGLVDKFMSQTRPRGFVECNRFNQVMGFNRNLFPNPWPSFRVPHDEDHDIHLQFLTRGYRTAVLTEYSKVDNKQASGGCNDWRSPEIFRLTYDLLQEYWPTIVTVKSATKIRYNWQEAKRIGGIT